jgi:uncharacterized protein (TIGR01777 family)
MKIVIAGASGFIGRALVPALIARGHTVVRLVRGRSQRPDELSWTATQGVPPGALAGAEAVINLCGENIAGRRWTSKRKKVLVHSRIEPTEALVGALHLPPGTVKVYIGASALGYYGNTGDFVVSEDSRPGQGFLARLCVEWEAAASGAAALGVRWVRPRFGIVLGPGGALERMVPLFRKGLGGRLGSGRQWMSWISRSDAVAALLWCLENESAQGPVNLCSPQPVTNAEFTAQLARAVGRTPGIPVPGFVLSALLGQLAREALLTSCRARPAVLMSAGFSFRHTGLQTALDEALAGK